MTDISFVVYFFSSSPLQHRVRFLYGFSRCLMFILPPLSRLMRVQVCKWVHKVHTQSVCTCMHAHLSEVATYSLSNCGVTGLAAPMQSCFFHQQCSLLTTTPTLCDVTVVVCRHPQRCSDGSFRLCLQWRADTECCNEATVVQSGSCHRPKLFLKR